MNIENIIGIAAGVCTATSMVPQLIKTFKEKNAESLSVAMLLVLITGVSLWVYYGILKNDLPIIITNAFSVLINSTLLVCAFIYKKNNNAAG